MFNAEDWMLENEPRAASTRRYSRTLAVLAVLLVSLAACGSDGSSVQQASFEQRLVDRQGISADEARCVSGYVFDGYSDDEIRLLYDTGLSALPSPLWAEYGHAMLGCLFHDDLEGSTPR
jgi:hypothetical protein